MQQAKNPHLAKRWVGLGCCSVGGASCREKQLVSLYTDNPKMLGGCQLDSPRKCCTICTDRIIANEGYRLEEDPRLLQGNKSSTIFTLTWLLLWNKYILFVQTLDSDVRCSQTGSCRQTEDPRTQRENYTRYDLLFIVATTLKQVDSVCADLCCALQRDKVLSRGERRTEDPRP